MSTCTRIETRTETRTDMTLKSNYPQINPYCCNNKNTAGGFVFTYFRPTVCVTLSACKSYVRSEIHPICIQILLHGDATTSPDTRHLQRFPENTCQYSPPSTASEWVFSAVGNIIIPLRASLKLSRVNMLVFLVRNTKWQ